MNDHLRQTGRTTRLVANAISYDTQGHEVYVLVHDLTYARVLAKHAMLRQRPGIKVEVVPENFDWTTFRLETRPDAICLVDHAAIEVKLQRLDEHILRQQQLARQLYALTT